MTKVRELETKIKMLLAKLNEFKGGKKYTEKDIELLQDQLRVIDEQYNDGAIKEQDGSIAAGQAEFSDYLNDAHELIADLLEALEPEEEA
jgi:hypothetical protein